MGKIDNKKANKFNAYKFDGKNVKNFYYLPNFTIMFFADIINNS